MMMILSKQTDIICMRHGPGFISPSRNLSCLATICQKLAGRRLVTNQSDSCPIPGVLSLTSRMVFNTIPGIVLVVTQSNRRVLRK